MKTVILLVLYSSIVGHTTAQELSTKILDFLTLVTGDADNKAQVDLKGNDYDLIEIKIRRIRVPSLEPNLTLAVEKILNGKMKYVYLGVVHDGPDNSLTVKLYNVTDDAGVPIESYDLDQISQVKQDHLKSDDMCVASFELWGKSVMVGVYPDCRYITKGKHPHLIITYTCDIQSAVYPFNVLHEKHEVGPYIFQTSARQPLTDAPQNYTSPCDL